MESPLSPERRRHTGFLTAGAVVAMILAGLGIAGAQTSEAPTTQAPAGQEQQAPAAGEKGRRGPGPAKVNLAVAAGAIGISVDELRAALQSGQSIAQVAQSKNVDPQKVIDALVTNITADLPERITAAVNQPGGPGGPGGPGHGKRGHHGPKPNLSAAATALGMSEAELRIALQSGQSLAQVAQSKNVDVQKVIDALVAEAKSRLAADVAAGRLTQAQADQKAANLTQRITDMVNRTGGEGPRGRKQGPPPADAPAATTPAAATA